MFAFRSPISLLTTAAIAYAGYNMFKSRKSALSAPSSHKHDPVQLDKMLDTAIEDSMAASDPPSISQPEVRR